MKTSIIGNLGASGINTDLPTWTLDGSFFTDGRNFRVIDGAVNPNSRFKTVLDNPVDSFLGFIMSVTAASTPWWMTCGRTKVYVFDGANMHDVTGTEIIDLPIDGELGWTGCMLGKIPVINHPGLQPYYWSPQDASVAIKPLPFDATNSFADKNIEFRVIRSHKNYLFALNLEESGLTNENAYRWSHPADINGIPYTWDETDTAALAGRAQLGGDAGAIVDGVTLRDAFIIYSERSIDALYESDDTFVWKRVEISNTVGLASKNSLVEVNGFHYFLSDADVIRNNGNELKSIASQRIRYMIFYNSTPDFFYRSFAVHNSLRDEIWFCIPSNGSEYPSIAYIYNYNGDTWSHKELPIDLKHAAYGRAARIISTYDTADGTYAEQTGSYGSGALSPLSTSLVGVTDTETINLDPFVGDQVVTNPTVIERINLPLDGQIAVSSIVRAYPHISGFGDFCIELGSHDFVDSPIRWKPAVVFNPDTDRKVDIRTTGALHAYRITSTSSDIWRFSGMDIEYAEAGER